MLKAIAFDFDGVLADTFEKNYKIFNEIFTDVSVESFKDHHNGNVYEKPLIKFSGEQAELYFNEYFKRIKAGRFFPLVENIKELAERYLLFIISSNKESGIGKYLELEGIDRCFEQVLGCGTHKSKVEKFKMIFSEYAVDPTECVFITDTLGDVLEAKIIGVKSIAVTWGYHDRDRLAKGKPEYIIEKTQELIPTIKKLDCSH